MEIIATLTGIIGAITGCFSLYKVNTIKSIDLGLEKGKSQNRIESYFEELGQINIDANESREKRLAAQGLYNSGNMEKWKASYKEKTDQILELKTAYKAIDEQIKSKSLKEIESDILKYHKLEVKLESINKFFKDSMLQDDSARDKIHKLRLEK